MRLFAVLCTGLCAAILSNLPTSAHKTTGDGIKVPPPAVYYSHSP